jgi:DNA repair protein RecO (recombination protein O)
MAILQTEAVVMKGWKLGETSKILSLYTRDYGKIKVVAKGARSPKSKFKGCLEPLTYLRICYYDKRTRELQLLSHADLINSHRHIIGNVKKTTLGLAVIELLNRAVAGEESNPQIFELLVSVIQSINQGQGFLEAFLWFFESHFIELMGYRPTWDQCLLCRKSLGADGGYFQPQSGGLCCNHCGSEKGGLVVGGETLEILYWLQRENVEHIDKIDPTVAQKAEIRRMFDLYFKTHIEHMKSLNALKLYYELKEGN